MVYSDIFRNLKILVTGHTGFKGTWLTNILHSYGANIFGVSLPLSSENKFYLESNTSLKLTKSYFVDLRQQSSINEIINSIEPDYIFHFAAQPLISKSLLDPLQTISTNVIGTSVLLLSALNFRNLRGITVAATDKVYQSRQFNHSFIEDDSLGGSDPYSASKAATEIIIGAIFNSCNPYKVPITTIRAGNVVGFGDNATNRLIPDIMRSVETGESLMIRNLNASRPWQYISDALSGYLLAAESQLKGTFDETYRNFNIGPSKSLSVQNVLDLFSKNLPVKYSLCKDEDCFSETKHLEINSNLARKILGWNPRFDSEQSITETINCYLKVKNGSTISEIIEETILLCN